VTGWKLYHDYASWFTMLTPPHEYDVTASHFAQGLEDAARRPVRDVLILGSGAGNTAGWLKERFTLTLSDISEEMLAESKKAHPECEHLIGDMRTMRLKKKFDGVLVEDAIMYMMTEEDLAAVMATAFAHLRPGGSAVFGPDVVAETYQPHTESGGEDGDGRTMRYLMWELPTRKGATKHEVVFVYVFKEGRKPIVVDHEVHEFGVFPRATWERLIVDAGFEFDELWETSELTVVFSARRPARGPARAAKKAGVTKTIAKKAGARKSPKSARTVLRVCSRCGTMVETSPDSVPMGWSVEFAGGRVEYLCPNCARANIRALEGRLPEEYWQ
jgi:SAM-dependent methyltransferase